jgi:hypothetical protein
MEIIFYYFCKKQNFSEMKIRLREGFNQQRRKCPEKVPSRPVPQRQQHSSCLSAVLIIFARFTLKSSTMPLQVVPESITLVIKMWKLTQKYHDILRPFQKSHNDGHGVRTKLESVINDVYLS